MMSERPADNGNVTGKSMDDGGRVAAKHTVEFCTYVRGTESQGLKTRKPSEYSVDESSRSCSLWSEDRQKLMSGHIGITVC